MTANVSLKGEYSKKELKRVLRIELQDFKRCIAREVRKGRIFQKVFIVHLRTDGRITVREVR